METVIADDGALLQLGSLAQTLLYSGNNVIGITVQAADPNGVLHTYKQTLTYSGALVTNISGWVKQ